jgi:hypothetical protein
VSKILTKADVAKMNAGKAFDASLFAGSMTGNMDSKEAQFLKDKDGKEMQILVESAREDAQWTGTSEYSKHWNMIKEKLDVLHAAGRKENVAQLPSEYYDLIDAISVDITRRRMQEADWTSIVTMEEVNFNFSKSVDLQEFLGFAGEFQANNLAGDAVPLIEQKTGAEGSVKMQGYALGNVRSLEDVLYNLDIYSIQKVNEAYVRAFVGKRNDLVFGPMIAITDATGWDAGQTVAAATGSGLSNEELVYQTINSAIEKLGKLHDFQTRQEIDLNRIVIATGRNVDARKIDRAIRGQLNNSKGATANREPLEVDSVILYKGDTITYGGRKVTYPGIADDKAYMFVPGPAGAPNWTLVKRGLTTVTSQGDALTLGQGKEARYFIQTVYNDEWYGSSGSNTTITGDTSHTWGWIVELNIPS